MYEMACIRMQEDQQPGYTEAHYTNKAESICKLYLDIILKSISKCNIFNHNSLQLQKE